MFIQQKLFQTNCGMLSTQDAVRVERAHLSRRAQFVQLLRRPTNTVKIIELVSGFLVDINLNIIILIHMYVYALS